MFCPATPSYLVVPYSSKPWQRGGTLIAVEVQDLQTHRQRLADPDGYRPDGCPRCSRRVGAHDGRYRKLRNQPGCPEVAIRRYRCRPCRAVWQVLPGVIARYLHRTWSAVQSGLVTAGEVTPGGGEWKVRLPRTTLHRWCWRLQTSGLSLTQALSEAGTAVAAVLHRTGIDCSRQELVEALAEHGLTAPRRKLEDLAVWVHRLVPGIRLM